MDYDLGFSDEETTRLEPIANLLEAKVLPLCGVNPLGRTVNRP